MKRNSMQNDMQHYPRIKGLINKMHVLIKQHVLSKNNWICAITHNFISAGYNPSLIISSNPIFYQLCFIAVAYVFFVVMTTYTVWLKSSQHSPFCSSFFLRYDCSSSFSLSFKILYTIYFTNFTFFRRKNPFFPF